jgi:CheY-like chemotaxis protein
MSALPYSRYNRDTCKESLQIAKDLNTLQKHPHSVLVVEDEFLIRFMISDYLAECGFHVLEASSADDAIDLLETMPVDVVFSDVNMPGKIDGFGLAHWIRANRPETLVLLTSGVARKANAMAHGLPPDSLVEKPYDVRHVAEHIQYLVEAMH